MDCFAKHIHIDVTNNEKTKKMYSCKTFTNKKDPYILKYIHLPFKAHGINQTFYFDMPCDVLLTRVKGIMSLIYVLCLSYQRPYTHATSPYNAY